MRMTGNKQSVDCEQYLEALQGSVTTLSAMELKSEGQDSPLVVYHHSQASLDTLTHRHTTLPYASVASLLSLRCSSVQL